MKVNNKENEITVLEHLDAYRKMREVEQNKSAEYWKKHWKNLAKKYKKNEVKP